jgi:hypothetical protein
VIANLIANLEAALQNSIAFTLPSAPQISRRQQKDFSNQAPPFTIWRRLRGGDEDPVFSPGNHLFSAAYDSEAPLQGQHPKGHPRVGSGPVFH